jgi:hypothetical protein
MSNLVDLIYVDKRAPKFRFRLTFTPLSVLQSFRLVFTHLYYNVHFNKFWFYSARPVSSLEQMHVLKWPKVRRQAFLQAASRCVAFISEHNVLHGAV